MKQTRKNRFRRKKALTRAVVIRRVRRALGVIAGMLLLAGVSAGFVFAYDYFTQSGHFTVRRIEVQGNQRLTRQAILDRAGIDPDTNILALNLSVARRRLLADPWVAGARIARDIPSGLKITVTEQQALARLQSGDDAEYLLNADGRIFKRADELDRGDWPRITGLDDGDLPVAGRPVTKGMQAVMQLLRLSRETTSPLPYARIRDIAVDREIGISVTLRESRRTIRLGFGNYRAKCAVLDRLTARFGSDPRLADCKMIDLYDINRIVITRAPDSAADPDKEEVKVAGT